MSITTQDETIDSREVIERIEELTAEFTDATDTDPSDYAMSEDDWAVGLGADGAAEIVALMAFAESASSVSDWQYGELFIRDDFFTEYTEEYLKDCGYLPANLPGWIAIDWEKTADAVQQDYTDYELDGVTYWARA